MADTRIRIESDAISRQEIEGLTEDQYDAWLEKAGLLMGSGFSMLDADRTAYRLVTQQPGEAQDA